MSFLTPFFLLGALAIAGPIVFHLIRRTPRGEVPFSSLMFLTPTPPRLTRRSRLDNVLLLLLRAAALGLLALAFARPFLRQAASLDFGDGRAPSGSRSWSTPAPACAGATSGPRPWPWPRPSPTAGPATRWPSWPSTRPPGHDGLRRVGHARPRQA